MDLISGIAVSNIGHSHPKVIQSYQETGRYIYSPNGLRRVYPSPNK